MTEGEQPHLEWATEGAVLLAQPCPVLVVVDVLRFTTAVEVAVTHGARVVPARWRGRETGGAGPHSLSPVSLLGIASGTRLELASPNGAMVAMAAAGAGAVVLAGCLRNASAVAAAARGVGGPVGVVAAGERRPDGSLRFAVEDLLGAGAILTALGGRPSPEARAAVAAFLDAAPTCRQRWPAAPPAGSWSPEVSPPTSAWPPSTTSAGPSRASSAAPSLS